MPKELWQLLALYLAVVNLAGFALMGIDKWKAKRGAWRISEKTLFLPAVLGGCVGCILGMRTFRHKTKHLAFQLSAPLGALLSVALMIAASVHLLQA